VCPLSESGGTEPPSLFLVIEPQSRSAAAMVPEPKGYWRRRRRASWRARPTTLDRYPLPAAGRVRSEIGASGRRWRGRLTLLRKRGPVDLLPVISILKRRQPFEFDVDERLWAAEAPFIFLAAHRISDDKHATGSLRLLRRHSLLAVYLGL
jgi:hypothetical protein